MTAVSDRMRVNHSGDSAFSIGAAFLASTDRAPAAVALRTFEMALTYGELRARALAIAWMLRSAGIAAGEHVALVVDDTIASIELVLGATLSGAVPVMFNPSFAPDDMHRLSRGLDIRAGFLSELHRDLAAFVVGPRPVAQPVRIIAGDTIENLTRPSAEQTQEILDAVDRTGPGAPWLVAFSSGATTAAKLCRISHENVLCKIAPFAERFDLDEHSRIWLAVPRYLIGFLKPLVTALAVGSTVLAGDSKVPSEWLDFLEKTEVTHAYPVYPAMWSPLLALPSFQPSRFASLSRLCLLGTLPVLRRIQRALPQCVVMNTYGSAEEAGAFCLPDSQDPAQIRLGSAGRPFPGHEIRIVDPKLGTICGPDGIGEIQVRGRGVVEPYLNFPQTRSPDGWLRTEDLGFVDAQGCVHYLGRLSELLSLGNENVSATTIEAVLNEHPAIAVSQVIDLPDVIQGNVASAFVELRPGQILDPDDIIAFCRQRLKPAHVPRHLTVVAEWPLTASKISKRDLASLPIGPRLID
jgi:fatty-acyl-CoA synthase